MTEAPISTLRKAIRDLHGCNAVWVEAVAVHETSWEGVVQVFEVDRPDASRAYAWSYETAMRLQCHKQLYKTHSDTSAK